MPDIWASKSLVPTPHLIPHPPRTLTEWGVNNDHLLHADELINPVLHTGVKTLSCKQVFFLSMHSYCMLVTLLIQHCMHAVVPVDLICIMHAVVPDNIVVQY